MRAYLPPDVPPGGASIEAWGDQTVTFTTASVEGMPGELAEYLALASHIADFLPPRHEVALSIEPDWDGCDGRWLYIHLPVGRPSTAELCAVAVLEPGRIEAPTRPDHAEVTLSAEGWTLYNDRHEPPWGFWHVELPSEPMAAAEIALRSTIALFAVYDPGRWYVTMTVGLDDSWQDDELLLIPPDQRSPAEIDLRAWRIQSRLPPAPPTIAPAGSEPWAILCSDGYHHLHATPCFEGPSQITEEPF